MANKVQISDDKVVTVWKCQNPQDEICEENVEVNVDYFQDNGTPVCSGCDQDMLYDHTYILFNSHCPICDLS